VRDHTEKPDVAGSVRTFDRTPARLVKVSSADFVLSAARADDLPRDGVPQLPLVGRSNVGKSSLINALTGRRVARTSATPGKTRLANVYRVSFVMPEELRRQTAQPSRRASAVYLVDLPGYGYARGGDRSAREFAALTTEYFGEGPAGRIGRVRPTRPWIAGALLAVDGRHPGLPQDLAAWEWLTGLGVEVVVVATKMDQLTRAERERHRRQFSNTMNGRVLAVSARTGEGLDELWTAIVKLTNSPPR
jgi:GTP-binding protein